MRGVWAVAAALLWWGIVAAASGEVLRVGTSGDYAPFSSGKAGKTPTAGETPTGFDIALIEAWAEGAGHDLVWVPFQWPNLERDLREKRFDLAASGITVRPERSALGRFSVPLTETGAFALARNPERWSAITSLDRPQIKIAVNAGGHLERVAQQHFSRATLLVVPDNAAVVDLLASKQVHAVVTDSAEMPHWEARVDEALARIGPLTRDRKAWWIHPERADLAAELDTWLLAREADGRLAEARATWLGGNEAGVLARTPTADPLLALLASVDERLSMMPLVGFVKRRDGVPLEVPEREARVLDAAIEALKRAALRAEVEAPPDARVRAFFRAQMEAAKAVQWRAVKDKSFRPRSTPNLNDELRPGLLRIGTRIAELLLALPAQLDADAVRVAAASSLRAPYLEDTDREALATAILGMSGPELTRPGASDESGEEGQDQAAGIAQ